MNAIELKHVTKRYQDFTLDDISFQVPCGSIMGLIGENGAGKSTTIKLIMHLAARDAGEITVLGEHTPEGLERVKSRIGVVMDESCFPEVLSAKDVNGIMAGVYPNWQSDTYFAHIARFDLPMKKPIKDYSRGMKVKLSLAVALSHQATLLILDEATSGLDPVVRDEMLDVFLEFIQDENNAILISMGIYKRKEF